MLRTANLNLHKFCFLFGTRCRLFILEGCSLQEPGIPWIAESCTKIRIKVQGRKYHKDKETLKTGPRRNQDIKSGTCFFKTSYVSTNKDVEYLYIWSIIKIKSYLV